MNDYTYRLNLSIQSKQEGGFIEVAWSWAGEGVVQADDVLELLNYCNAFNWWLGGTTIKEGVSSETLPMRQ